MGKAAKLRKSIDASRIDHASAARSRVSNSGPATGPAAELAPWRPLWPHTASGFESYNRSKSIWWDRAIGWVRSERASPAVLAALMQLTGKRLQPTGIPLEIPGRLEIHLVYFALWRLRYPICPGELQLEADRPERGPLCKWICQKHHPDGESAARHPPHRIWTQDPMEICMRRAWHSLPGKVKQSSIDRYNEVDRLRMGDGSQLKRLLEVDDTSDEELKVNGTAMYLGEWFPKDYTIGSQPIPLAAGEIKQEKRGPSTMQPFHLPRQLFTPSAKAGPSTETVSASGTTLENTAEARVSPPIGPPKPHTPGSKSIPIGPRGWVASDPVRQTLSGMFPSPAPSPSPPVIPGHKCLWVPPGPSPLAPGPKQLPGDPRAKETKNRVVPVHNLSPAVTETQGLVGLGLYMEGDDESEIDIDLRAASDEINTRMGGEPCQGEDLGSSEVEPVIPQKLGPQISVPAELHSLVVPDNGKHMDEALQQIVNSLQSSRIKEARWDEQRKALEARVGRYQERGRKMEADIERLRGERNGLRDTNHALQKELDQYKSKYHGAEVDKVELQAKNRELERKLAR